MKPLLSTSITLRAFGAVAALLSASPAWAQTEDELGEESEIEEPASVDEGDAEPEVTLDEEPVEESEAEGSLSLGASAGTSVGIDADEGAEKDIQDIEEDETIPATDNRGDLPYIPFEGMMQDGNHYFGWDVGVEMDVGFADYRFSASSHEKETFHDARGQIWLAPVYEHRFGKRKDVFLRGSAEFVAWLREQESIYQVNVFDAYAQLGVDDVADLKIGRVTTWRVYQPGSGFDIYTLEDTGCLVEPPIEGKNFCIDRYEVDHIWLRGTPYRGALHVYPLKKLLPDEWSNLGLEATVEYGKENNSNVLGARGAIVYDHKWLRLAGGAEHRWKERALRNTTPEGETCDKCTESTQDGYGASAVLRPPFLEGGLNYAATEQKAFNLQGEEENADQRVRNTRGGYIELHTGHLLASTKKGPRPGVLADQRSENIRQLTFGYGQHRTEVMIGNGNFQIHTQRALYAKYNLGFNMAYLKLVGSASDAFHYNLISAAGAAEEYSLRESDMLAVRLRFAYFF